MKTIRKKYTLEYKILAVAVCSQYGSVSRAAQELGISISNFYYWKRLIGEGKLALQKASGSDSKTKELSRLRREIKDIRAERDILKKEPDIFSWGDGRDTSLSGKTLVNFPSGRCARFLT